jgi:hypothetical protein
MIVARFGQRAPVSGHDMMLPDQAAAELAVPLQMDKKEIKGRQLLNNAYPMRYGLVEQIWPRSHAGVIP